MGYVVMFSAILIDGLLFNSYAIGDKAKLSGEVLSNFFYLSSGIAMVAGIFLAMRLLAEEKQMGTLVLLFTSPITERQLIYGKFLSSLAFFSIMLILTLHLPALIFIEGKVSFGHLAAGYLGLFLIGSAVLAITLFASVVSPNQMIAGILGASITVILLVLWMLASVVDEPFRSIFNYLSIHNLHFNSFSRGIIHSKDIIFYLSLIVFFLECSVRTIEVRRYQG
tara:strand:- start:83 stop:754 length:672 start_codon:yes stop_codon:yes gene_type:complete